MHIQNAESKPFLVLDNDYFGLWCTTFVSTNVIFGIQFERIWKIIRSQ